jgi:hypothetical protein
MFSCFVRLRLTLLCVAVLAGINRAAKQEIYYGEDNFIPQLLNNTSKWTYVQENADGLYVSFGQMTGTMSLADLLGFFRLFKNQSVYFESDANPDHQPLERDKTDIGIFHNIGWNITHTSQNYGWTVERDEIGATII